MPTDPEALKVRREYVARVQALLGEIAYPSMMRIDLRPGHSILSSLSHIADEYIVKQSRQLAMYFVSTPDEGPSLGGTYDDAVTPLTEPPYVDVEGVKSMRPTSSYFVYSDGDLFSMRVSDEWALQINKGRSRLGIMHFCFGACIAGSSRNQHSVALTILDSEAMAATSAAASAYPIRGVLHFLGFSQEGPTPLFIDNMSTVQVAKWIASQKRSLYLVRRIYFLQEMVEDGEILPISCTGPLNLADPLTKLGFTKIVFKAWRDVIFGTTRGSV